MTNKTETARAMLIANLEQASAKLLEAAAALEFAADLEGVAGNYDALHYASQVRNILSSDGGECGLLALVNSLRK